MVRSEELVVDDKLFVNETTLEAVNNQIEGDVRRSLWISVLLPLLAAGIALMLLGVFWMIPREVGALLREDPFVNQRFREATAQYLSTPEGQKAIREQIVAAIEEQEELRKLVDQAVSESVAKLDVDASVARQVDQAIEAQPLGTLVNDFLSNEEGRKLLSGSTQAYFASAAGREQLSRTTARELESARFRSIMVDELDRALRQ